MTKPDLSLLNQWLNHSTIFIKIYISEETTQSEKKRAGESEIMLSEALSEHFKSKGWHFVSHNAFFKTTTTF